MTTKSNSPGRVSLVAFFMVLTISALVQAPGAAASPDMRLWSFGDCERKYPRADSTEYRECMRVVGSPESKDLRAQRSCEDSYANDPKGIDGCLSAYRLTKENPAPAIAATTLSPDMTRYVQAIAAAAVEQTDTTPKEAVATESAAVRAGSSLTSLVLVGVLGILLLGVGGAVLLRREV